MYKEDDNVLNELISRGDCANCKICCKFEPDELIDAPTFTKKQMQYIKDNINENLKFTKIDNKILTDFIKRKFFIIAEKVVRENPGMITEYNRDLDILYEFSINE